MMKKILLALSLLNLSASNAQTDFYYSAQKTDSIGTKEYWLFDKNGELMFDEGHDWISVNVWGWVFTFDDKKITAYDTNYTKLPISNIDAFHHVWMKSKLIPLKVNGLWGYYDKSGKEIIKPKFDDITLFKNGKAAVKSGNNTFYINEKGEKMVETYNESSDYEFVKLSSAYGLTSWENYPQEKFEVNSKFGLREVASQNILIPATYDNLYNLQDKRVTAELNSKFGVLDFENNSIIPFDYERIIVLD